MTEDISYDIMAEDALTVIASQRDAFLAQLTTAQIELHKARTIIAKLNEEVSAFKTASKKSTAKKAA